MTEIKIATPLLTYRFEEDGTKEELSTCLRSILDNKVPYENDGKIAFTIVPYHVLRKSVIKIYEK